MHGVGVGTSHVFLGGDTPALPPTPLNPPILTKTSAAGGDRMSWQGSYPNAIQWDGSANGDKVDMQWRVNGGAWNPDTRQVLDSAALLAGSFPWPLFGATAFSAGDFVEAQERMLQFVGGVAILTSAWSNIVSDTMATATLNPALRVTMANQLIKLADLNPFIRNTNTTTSPIEIKVGPQALINLSPTSKLMLFEGVQNTGYAANNGETAFMRATATSWQGPWTISPATLVLAAGDTTTWEYNEFSPANAIWDAGNSRFIVVAHGGNNNGPRQGGVAYSTDGQTGQAWTKEATNPKILVGAAGSFDDHQAGGDLKTIWEPNLNAYVGFYRAQRNGSPQTDGTVGRVTSPDFINWTKTGQVISASPSWNTAGITSGQPFRDAGGRYHMFAPGGAAGIGYYYSDDYGVTWTAGNSGNTVAAPSGTAGAYDQFSTGDVVQGAADGDVIFLTFGTENISTYPTNNPMRGQSMAITPFRAVTPTRKGKFYLPSARTDVTSTALLTQTVFTIMGRFRAYRVNRSKARMIYTEEASGGSFNKTVQINIGGGAGATDGELQLFYRTPTALVNIFTTTVVDDAVWHTFLVRRISTSSFELYIGDGAGNNWSAAVTSAVNPATDATAMLKSVGNFNPTTGEPDSPFNGTLSDIGIVTGYAATTAEAKAWIASRTALGGGTVVFDLTTNGTTGESGDVALVEAT